LIEPEDTAVITELHNLPAPAKINLFLHVTGRRPDGYHELQTVFQFIDLSDYIDLRLRTDGQIIHENPIKGVQPEHDLCIRAAHCLSNHAIAKKITKHNLGVSIRLEKNIPMGAGLGGGSSDAATVLLGLNRLWNLELSTSQLAALGLQLGADVPVFVRGFNALATGIGERLKPIKLPIRPLVLVKPATSVPTPVIFRAPELTRNTEALKIAGFPANVLLPSGALPGRNDLESVAAKYFKPVGKAIQKLKLFAPQFGCSNKAVRMSGSGSSVFVWCSSQEQAQGIARAAKDAKIGKVQVVQTLQSHPLADQL
jgi:4-diphosphocytidyl-2-C-methyl-D-erythritol kinase